MLKVLDNKDKMKIWAMTKTRFIDKYGRVIWLKVKQNKKKQLKAIINEIHETRGIVDLELRQACFPELKHHG